MKQKNQEKILQELMKQNLRYQLALEDYELGTENELNLLMVIWKKFCKVGIRGLDILVMPILII